MMMATRYIHPFDPDAEVTVVCHLHPAEPQTRHFPGCPAHAEVVRVVDLCGNEVAGWDTSSASDWLTGVEAACLEAASRVSPDDYGDREYHRRKDEGEL